MTDNCRTVHLPEDLCSTLEQRYSHQFANIEGLITFVLQDLGNLRAGELDRQELEIVERRLKDLGYL